MDYDPDRQHDTRPEPDVGGVVQPEVEAGVAALVGHEVHAVQEERGVVENLMIRAIAVGV